MHNESGKRRLHPRMTDTDWLVLRELRPAIEKLASQIVLHGKRAVDVGCGSQPYRQLFESRGAVYHGADFGAGDLAIGEDGRVPLDDSSVDLVLSFQVLEHVADVTTYLAEALRLLRSDGWLLLSTHGTWLYHPHPQDHRRWTREGLLAELARHGFATTECIPILGPLAWTTVLRLTCAYHALRRVSLAGRMLASTLAVLMNARGYLEDLITPEWVRRDNACVYVTLSRVVGRSPP